MGAAHKTTLYREVNVTTEAMLAQFEADDPGHFLCECRDGGCSRRLALRRSEYEAVRLSGGYLVSLECIADSEVLHRTDGYASVAFRGSATGEAAAPSLPESSWSESSPPESSATARSRPAASPRVSLLPQPSPSALPESSERAPSRRAVLRLVTAAAPSSPPRSVFPSSRLWHRRSQSGQVLVLPAAEPPPMRPVS